MIGLNRPEFSHLNHLPYQTCMERIFSTFRLASQEASRLCKEHGANASLERKGDSWAVIFDGPVPSEVSGPDPAEHLQEINELREALDDLRSHAHDVERQHRAEVFSLENQLNVLQRECESLHKKIEGKNKIIFSHEKEFNLLKPFLPKEEKPYFSTEILKKMSKENAYILSRYGYLCNLNDSGKINAKAFDDFKASSELWIAIHNYEKLKNGPQQTHGQDYKRPAIEICSSCGGAVMNGHCKCSN